MPMKWYTVEKMDTVLDTQSPKTEKGRNRKSDWRLMGKGIESVIKNSQQKIPGPICFPCKF